MHPLFSGEYEVRLSDVIVTLGITEIVRNVPGVSSKSLCCSEGSSAG